MVRLLGLTIGESFEPPRDVSGKNEGIGSNGWLIRFFDSAFFCEWIAVSYLYKHEHPGVRDYLCNRMYTLPLSGIESYLFQVCYMMVHKPSPSLDRFVIDICSKSLKIALKVHWILMAEIEDSDDNEGISRIQEKCQIAATLSGEWPPLIKPPGEPAGSGSKNQVLSRILSSKQRLLSLASSPPTQWSLSLSPSAGPNVVEEGRKASPDDNKIFKKFMPGPKVRDALRFTKSMEKDAEESDKDGFFKRLLRDSKDEDAELTSSTDSFFKRLFRDSRGDSEEISVSRSLEDDEKDSLFRKFFKDKSEEKRELNERKEEEDKGGSSQKSIEDEEKEGFFKKIFKEKVEDKKDGNVRTDVMDRGGSSKSSVDYEEEGFFKKMFKEKIGNKKDENEKNEKNENGVRVCSKSFKEDDREGFFRKIFREKTEEQKGGREKLEDEENEKNEKAETIRSKSFKEGVKEGLFRKIFKEKNEEKKAEREKSVDEGHEIEERVGSKPRKEDDKEGVFRKIFKDKSEEKKACRENHEDEDDEREGFIRKFFKETFEDKKDDSIGMDDEEKIYAKGEEEESSDFSLFRKLFRVHPEDVKEATAGGNVFEGSPGTENFFRKLFKDRDRSVEDSELYGSRKQKARQSGSPNQKNENSNSLPPLPINAASQFRKGAYHESLDFVQSLCDASYGLVDVFPVEDRKSALRESLAEINSHLAEAQNIGGVCFPLGRGMYSVINIPENEAVLLNSREKAPYLICVEVIKCETQGNSKDPPSSQKLSGAGIPLAHGVALLPEPPPWAHPLRSMHRDYHGTDRMSGSASQAIDQAMSQFREAKIKFVDVNFSVDEQFYGRSYHRMGVISGLEHCDDHEWVRVVLTADPKLHLEDIEDPEPPRRKVHRRVPSTIAMEEVKAAAAKGEAPAGLPLKGAGQDSSEARPKADASKPTDALSGELWEVKKERIRKTSLHGKLPGWDLCSVIVKSGDDCRQEHLAVQLIAHFYDIFQEAGLPLWLRPYEVLVTSSYTALIETIPDTASIHSIKSRYPYITSLRQFFNAKYEENSSSFKLAQRNFVESMAGYSLVCYLLQVKDRHNGNLLLDEDGHIIHIDFGFMLSNSPGGVNFESAPFKLTRELLEVMDSDAEGIPSEFFDYFKVLCIQGFLTCRKHAERIILLVEMLQDSGFPCFKGGLRTIQNLRKRFHLSLTEEQCVSLVLSLISSSLDAWRTRQYDYYQRVLNGILQGDGAFLVCGDLPCILPCEKISARPLRCADWMKAGNNCWHLVGSVLVVLLRYVAVLDGPVAVKCCGDAMLWKCDLQIGWILMQENSV
ncbi:Phosphatidylinositol 4-kinase beta 1-like protein [Drosera capensis]